MAGLDASLAADVAQGHNHPLEPVDGGLGLRVSGQVIDLREGAQHDGVAIDAQQRGHFAPNRLGDERHHRMGGAQQQLQHFQQRVADGRLTDRVRFRVPEQWLGQLQIPVAVFPPGELMDRTRIEIEPVGIQRLGGGGDHPPGTGAYPPIGQARFPGCRQILALGVHQHEPRRVPELVAEVAVTLGAAEVEAHVAAGGCQGAEGEAQGIGAIGRDAVGIVPPRGFLDVRRQVRLGKVAGALGHQILQADAIDEVQGIQSVALGLGHLLAFRIAHQAVNVNLPKRHFAGEL